MKSEAFLIADFVSIADLKLTIVNTFDTIASDKFPFTFRPFGIAAKLIAGKAERGKEFESTLVLRKGETKIHEVHFKIKFPKPKGNLRASHLMAMNLLGVTFKAPGEYSVELKKGTKVISSTVLYVKKQQL
ncbi:MAG: hypothetical protein JSW07_04955 [bacterium]|nr:MAG: hypothetical protein JSW07_04955 [bacterium]